MLGTAALIITLSVLDGFEKEIKEKAIGFTAHIQTLGFSNKPLSYSKSQLEKIKTELPNINAVSPFVAREAMIRVKESVDGIFLKGVDPNNDISLIRNTIVDGNYFSAGSIQIPEIIIGKKLANKLNAGIGDKVIIFGLGMNNSQTYQPRVKQFRLTGVYESGMAEYDDMYAYVHLHDAQKIFQMSDAISGYDILVNDLSRVDETATNVDELLGYPHHSRTVFETYRNLFAWVDLQKEFSPIILALIIVVATVNIIGTLLMFVMEKVEAIGILRTMGVSKKGIQKIFISQGLLIASVGIMLGNFLAFILCWLQFKFKILSLPSDIYYMTNVPMLLRWENFVLVTIIAFILCLVTTTIPSRSASKLDPVQALRFG
jgi:lipoprotein-releasing system permease protein